MADSNTTRITLVPFSDAHIRQTFEWVQDDDLRALMDYAQKPSWEAHLAWIERAHRQNVFAIHADGRHVGNCGLKPIEHPKRSAALWIYIGAPDDRGKGIGRKALDFLIKKAFGILEFESIFLYFVGSNWAAENLYKSAGFEKQSPAQSPLRPAGGHREVVHMSLHRCQGKNRGSRR